MYKIKLKLRILLELFQHPNTFRYATQKTQTSMIVSKKALKLFGLN